MASEIDLDAREKLIQALASGANHSEAARVSGYSRKHVKTLVKDPSFMGLVAERRESAGVDVSGAVKVGLATLLEIAKSGENETARVSAAKALVAMGAPKVGPKRAEPAPPESPAGPDPTPDELQRSLRLLA